MRILHLIVMLSVIVALCSAQILVPQWREEARVKEVEDQKALDFERAASGLERLGAQPGDLIVYQREHGLWVYLVCDFNPRSRLAYVNDGSGPKLWNYPPGTNCTVFKPDSPEFSEFKPLLLVQTQMATN